MPQLNVEGSRRWEPILSRGYSWKQFTAADAHCLAQVKQAIDDINMLIASHPPCIEAFQAMPGGRSLAQLMRDFNIWVSFDPSDDSSRFGARLGDEITITRNACNRELGFVTGTLIHELAHINGVTSEASAEGTLKSCLLAKYYNPKVTNDLSSASRASGIIELNELLRRGPRVR